MVSCQDVGSQFCDDRQKRPNTAHVNRAVPCVSWPAAEPLSDSPNPWEWLDEAPVKYHWSRINLPLIPPPPQRRCSCLGERWHSSFKTPLKRRLTWQRLHEFRLPRRFVNTLQVLTDTWRACSLSLGVCREEVWHIEGRGMITRPIGGKWESCGVEGVRKMIITPSRVVFHARCICDMTTLPFNYNGCNATPPPRPSESWAPVWRVWGRSPGPAWESYWASAVCRSAERLGPAGRWCGWRRTPPPCTALRSTGRSKSTLSVLWSQTLHSLFQRVTDPQPAVWNTTMSWKGSFMNMITYSRPQVSNTRPAGQMRPTTSFYAALDGFKDTWPPFISCAFILKVYN